MSDLTSTASPVVPRPANRLNYFAHRMRSSPTVIEKKLWKFLQRKPLGLKFKKQVVLAPYIVDFYCRKLRLAIEADGQYHQAQVAEDQARDRALQVAYGVKVLRCTGADILSGEAMKRLIGLLRAAQREERTPQAKRRINRARRGQKVSYLRACQIEKRW